jgi:hypothetical protein
VADAIVKDRQEATIELITTLSNDARMLAVPTAAAPPESEAGVQVPMTLLPRERSGRRRYGLETDLRWSAGGDADWPETRRFR